MSESGLQRLRYPSVVAHRLAAREESLTQLLLDDQSIPRPEGFDPSQYSRARSYPEAESFRRSLPGVSGARFAGWQAVAFGPERQCLASAPTRENIDVLVHKAYLLSALHADRVALTLIADSGTKAEAILRYASKPPPVSFLAWSNRRDEPKRVELEVQAKAVDAATCAMAALPEKVRPQGRARLLLIDVGYYRTKLYVLSEEGCEYEEALTGLGISDCVLRLLRDGQERGLFEDEFAVIRALERSLDVIEIAGRRFEIRDILESARRSLEEEIARAARAAIVEHFKRMATPCKAAAILGGGITIVGKGLVKRLAASEMDMEWTWLAPDGSFHLLEGARRLVKRK